MASRRALGVLVLAVNWTITGCVGEPAERTTPPREVGHGSVAEVVAALALEMLPCANPQNQPLNGLEEAITCTIGTQRVTIVHFVDDAQAKQFEATLRSSGEPGVFGGTWAAKVPTERLAKRIASALANTTYV